MLRTSFAEGGGGGNGEHGLHSNKLSKSIGLMRSLRIDLRQ